MWEFWRKLKPAASPEERVLRFLKDYQAQHRAAKPLFDREERKGDRFSEWVNMLRPVKQGNFTDTSPVDLGSGYGNRPHYASRADEHVRSDSDGDITYVIFTNQEGMFGRFHEYVVESQRGDFHSMLGVANKEAWTMHTAHSPSLRSGMISYYT